MKLCQIKGSLVSSCHKNNPSSFQKLKKLLILIATTSIHIERFSGCVSDWSVLNNDWPMQKFDLLTLIWGSLCYSQVLNPRIPRRV